MPEALNVNSEVGELKSVLVHRPGAEHLNHYAMELLGLGQAPRFDLDKAQEEHALFLSILRSEGVKAYSLSDLLSEVLDASEQIRASFIDTFVKQSGLVGHQLQDAAREYLASCGTSHELISTMLHGLRYRELGNRSIGDGVLARACGRAPSPDAIFMSPIPYLDYTHDQVSVIGNGLCFSRMYWPLRDREVLFSRTLFENHPLFCGSPVWHHANSSFFLEGGDVLVPSSTSVIVGLSGRTEASAVDELGTGLLWSEENGFDTIYAIEFEQGPGHYLLDIWLSQVDYDRFLVYPPAADTMRIWRIRRGARPGELKVSQADEPLRKVLGEAVGCGSAELIDCLPSKSIQTPRGRQMGGVGGLCISPGRLVIFEDDAHANPQLERAGLQLLTFPSTELRIHHLNPHAITLPLVREGAPA